MSGAGKGDDYRRVDKKKFDKNYENIFGKKDIIEYHKDKDDKKEGLMENIINNKENDNKQSI